MISLWRRVPPNFGAKNGTKEGRLNERDGDPARVVVGTANVANFRPPDETIRVALIERQKAAE